MTVFVTTAYLDEAERCNRVGLMHQGRLMRCADAREVHGATERGLIQGTHVPDRGRGERARCCETLDGVISVGAVRRRICTCFCPRDARRREALRRLALEQRLGPGDFSPSSPSLEDVFIVLIRKEPARDEPPERPADPHA